MRRLRPQKNAECNLATVGQPLSQARAILGIVSTAACDQVHPRSRKRESEPSLALRDDLRARAFDNRE